MIVHVAEDILPGHPDRLADAVAEALVDAAVAQDPEALVGVEVGVHRKAVFVTGRIAAGQGGVAPRLDLEALAHGVYRAAAYVGRWALQPRVLTDLDIGPLGTDERAIRGFSDDQNIVVGYAVGSEATAYLPPAVLLVRRFREALSGLRERHAEVLGPDGKVLVWLHEDGGRFGAECVNVSLQHVPGVGHAELYPLVLPALEVVVAGLDDTLPGIGATWDASRVRVNGAGEFSCGGPQGDNGLSGKKLVVDHYGPGVPIGGGAVCGKDPHKVDRAGALAARQLAVRLGRATGARETSVYLAFVPGRAEPERYAACIDGVWWGAQRIAAIISVPDLSIDGSVRRFELAGVRWVDVLRRGYFGSGHAWDDVAAVRQPSAEQLCAAG